MPQHRPSLTGATGTEGAWPFGLGQLHELFMGEVTGLDLSKPLNGSQIDAVVHAIDLHGVLVFRGQNIDDAAQLRFTSYYGEPQKSITLHRSDYARRFRRDELSDISNLDEHGMRMDPSSTKRKLALSTRL